MIKKVISGGQTGIDTWKGTSGWAVHYGYRIPINKHLSFIPVLGHISTSSGVVDGSDWTIINNDIHNRFNVNDRKSIFDYGLVTCITVNKFVLTFKTTPSTIGGSLGFILFKN